MENEAHLKALREATKTGIADMESGCSKDSMRLRRSAVT